MRADADQVPFAANIMASRWAFEALAVNRYTMNAAEKPVYTYDQIISNSNFIHNYWIPRMKEMAYKIDEAQNSQRIYNEIYS